MPGKQRKEFTIFDNFLPIYSGGYNERLKFHLSLDFRDFKRLHTQVDALLLKGRRTGLICSFKRINIKKAKAIRRKIKEQIKKGRRNCLEDSDRAVYGLQYTIYLYKDFDSDRASQRNIAKFLKNIDQFLQQQRAAPGNVATLSPIDVRLPSSPFIFCRQEQLNSAIDYSNFTYGVDYGIPEDFWYIPAISKNQKLMQLLRSQCERNFQPFFNIYQGRDWYQDLTWTERLLGFAVQYPQSALASMGIIPMIMATWVGSDSQTAPTRQPERTHSTLGRSPAFFATALSSEAQQERITVHPVLHA